MKPLDTITTEEWGRLLAQVFQRVSAEPRVKPILEAIGPLRFQLLLTDRPELSYWEEYTGDRVVPHLGVTQERSVQAATTFPMLTGTLLRRVSLMEAAAEEAWDIKGDTEALLRCANLLPYVMTTFSEVLGERGIT